jgi:hypothetical protein
MHREEIGPLVPPIAVRTPHLHIAHKSVDPGLGERLPDGGVRGRLPKRVEVASNRAAEDDRILHGGESSSAPAWRLGRYVCGSRGWATEAWRPSSSSTQGTLELPPPHLRDQ